MRPYLMIVAPIALAVMALFVVPGLSQANPGQWSREWPNTDFTKHAIPFDQIMSGGVTKDRIPSIDEPRYSAVGAAKDFAPTEPILCPF